MRAAPLAIVVLLVALLAGCGSSEGTTTTHPLQGTGEIRSAWERNPACRRPSGASRWACSVGSYRCQGVVTGRGWSISCAKPGKAVAFSVRRG